MSLASPSKAVRASLSGSPSNAFRASFECSSASLAVRSAPDDFEIRYLAWIDGNRKKRDQNAEDGQGKKGDQETDLFDIIRLREFSFDHSS